MDRSSEGGEQSPPSEGLLQGAAEPPAPPIVIDIWAYLFETALGRQALRQLLQFIDTPQTFRLHLVQKQFQRRIPGSVTRLDLDQLVPSRRSSSTVAAGLGAGGLMAPLGPSLDWIIHACPDLECLRAPGCTWFQGERRAIAS